MSHISKIELEIMDLSVLRQACGRLGLEFVKDQRTYAWYGRWVGDTPLPEDVSIDELGRCDHAITAPGASYEIGVVRKGKSYRLIWDYYQAGGLNKVIGKDGGLLKQAYAVEKAKLEARRKGYSVTETATDTGLRLHVRLA